MSKIKILPEILSNKIAAGEVVERPASVVKELVENALDAGSSRIVVDIEKGGRSLIRVSDNGSGMGHDDALLALERYATSKIFKDQDLFAIGTLGFRGEALPSIAAVSRFDLTTRAVAADTGTEIRVEGGKIKDVREVGAPVGTMVAVRQLFFNTPARRKFLKTIGTETGHIADMVARIALGAPAVQFRLTHNGKTVKDWPAASKALDRVVDVLGRDLKNSLHAVEFSDNGLSVGGWVASPRVTRRTSRAIFIYVNGRFVRDRIVQHALFEGYAQRLVKGQFPVAVISIKLPFDAVDVNVHPTKNEVRFARQQVVHEAVRRAVAQKLYEVDLPRWRPADHTTRVQTDAAATVSEATQSEFGIGNAEGGIGKTEFGMRKVEFQINEQEFRSTDPATRNPQREIWQQKPFGSMRVIGQFHNSYIVCESEQGLILIDQHAAHERVLYEQFSGRATGAEISAQRLLVPETIELGYREAGVLAKMIPELSRMGLDVEPFGGTTFVVKAVPALLAGKEVKPILIEMVEKIAEIGAAPGLDQALAQCRIVMACHGAIRANQALSDTQIKGLLDQLDGCDNPSHCPHGRPTWLRWEMRALERSFKRIV